MSKFNFKELIPYVVIIVVVVLIRCFIVSPVQVDGGSMDHTLANGEIMLLNKISLKVSDINRFDIVVIDHQFSSTDEKHLIKRVIGLPGESIEYKDNVLYVDGKAIKEPFLDQKTEDFNIDTLGVSVVPKNSYFVLGDNRSNSADSRYIGFIDIKDIKGKANFVIFPFNKFGKVK